MSDHVLEYGGYRSVIRAIEPVTARTEPIVILGGSSQTRFSWQRYEPVLRDHAAVITMDLPGYGDGDYLPVDHGIDFLADAVERAAAAVTPGPVNLFGGCFGAVIALRVAQRHPGRVARLMLGATSLEIPSEFVRSMIRWRGMPISDDLVQEMVDRFMSPPDGPVVRRRAAVTRLMKRQWGARTEREIRLDLMHHERLVSHPLTVPGAIGAVPALVFTGEHDTLTTPDMGREVARRLAAPFVTITEADHLSSLERDAELADLMTRFFTDRPFDALSYLNPVEHPAVPVPA